jgi:hypothetical protein
MVTHYYLPEAVRNTMTANTAMLLTLYSKKQNDELYGTDLRYRSYPHHFRKFD